MISEEGVPVCLLKDASLLNNAALFRVKRTQCDGMFELCNVNKIMTHRGPSLSPRYFSFAGPVMTYLKFCGTGVHILK